MDRCIHCLGTKTMIAISSSLKSSTAQTSSTCRAHAISVREVRNGKKGQLARLLNIKADVYITNARVAVACAKYDRGNSSFVGYGDPTTLAITAGVSWAISKALAAHRRHGKMLVGHVRYPWLRAVGFYKRREIRLQVRDTSGSEPRDVFLDLLLAGDVDAGRTARVIACRCAAYRLAHTDVDEWRSKYEALRRPPELVPIPKKFVFYHMPTFFNALPQTAYPTDLSPIDSNAGGDSYSHDDFVEPSIPAGWAPDPSGRIDWRWWDGTQWTRYVKGKDNRVGPDARGPNPAPRREMPGGWYNDPLERGETRYWDGSVWTARISRNGSSCWDTTLLDSM